MGKVKGQKKSNNRKESLLPTTNGRTGGNARCGACSRLVFFILPILGCAFIIGSLYLLTYSLGVPITDTSISALLAAYEPKVEILIPIFIGATLMFTVTAMRNVQINVYHRRQKDETICMKVTNLIAAISNILAYVGFVLLAVYDLDGPGEAPTIHYVGAFMYFILSGVYQVLHSFLLWKQSQYPLFCKILFTIVSVATIACSSIYCVDQENHMVFEWFAVALAALNVGMVSILFLVDSVDDELRDFFCCRRVSKY